ncbi:MAG: hypothetical protein OWT27_10335, partial [Firmicutes bacterium]|nr:hypothetical protein [Bacillota bacterium]
MQKRLWGVSAAALALTCLTVTGCGTRNVDSKPNSKHLLVTHMASSHRTEHFTETTKHSSHLNVFNYMDMVNKLDGWGIANGTSILVTHNGWRTEQQIKIPFQWIQPFSFHYYGNYLFLKDYIGSFQYKTFLSTNYGKSWTISAHPISVPKGYSFYSASFYGKDGLIDFVRLGNAVYPGLLFSTSNYGNKWVELGKTNYFHDTPDPHNFPFGGKLYFVSHSTVYMTGFPGVAGPSNIGGYGFVWLFRSSNSGLTWHHVNILLNPKWKYFFPQITDVSVDAKQTYVIIELYNSNSGTEHEYSLYKLNESGLATLLSNHIPKATQVYFYKNNGFLFNKINGDLYISNDQGKKWTELYSIPRHLLGMSFTAHKIFGFSHKRIYSSSTSGVQ